MLRERSKWRKNRGGVDSNRSVCAGVRNAILAQDIYCANTNTEPDAQSGYRVRKVFGTQALSSTWE